MPMQKGSSCSTWVEVDLGAIEENTHRIKEITGVQVMAVVKANAYGHGTIPAVKAVMKGGANWCGVARIEEALELRLAGVDCSILGLGFTPPERFREAIENDISLTVWNNEQLEIASSNARVVRKPAKLHLKVDTGMNRLGIQPKHALEFAQKLSNLPEVIFEGVFTHYARADEVISNSTIPDPTELQEKMFNQLLDDLDAAGLKPPHIHAANSAATFHRPTSRYTMVRTGNAVYGLNPSSERPLLPGFKPALSWKTILSQVRVVPPGRGVSYGHIYTTSSYERIGVVPVGYADGYRRTSGNLVLVGGKRVPIVGRVCMDQIMVQLDHVPSAKENDEVVLIGKQAGERISADEVADTWGTINYEVVCGIDSRVPRYYTNRSEDIQHGAY